MVAKVAPKGIAGRFIQVLAGLRAAKGKGWADLAVTAVVVVLSTVAALFLNATTPIRFIERARRSAAVRDRQDRW